MLVTFCLCNSSSDAVLIPYLHYSLYFYFLLFFFIVISYYYFIISVHISFFFVTVRKRSIGLVTALLMLFLSITYIIPCLSSSYFSSSKFFPSLLL